VLKSSLSEDDLDALDDALDAQDDAASIETTIDPEPDWVDKANATAVNEALLDEAPETAGGELWQFYKANARGRPIRLSLHRHRMTATNGEGAMSFTEFKRQVIEANKARNKAKSDQLFDEICNHSIGWPALWRLFWEHVPLPAERMLNSFRGRDSIARLSSLAAALRAGRPRRDEVEWAERLAHCYADFPMSDWLHDDIRRFLSEEPCREPEPGWMSRAADYVNESANRLKREPHRPIEQGKKAFMIAWDRLARERTGRPLSRIGRNLFMIIFGLPNAYSDEKEGYGTVVRRHIRHADGSG
jgi:hypothetical protein